MRDHVVRTGVVRTSFDALLAAGAAARMTRFVVTDDAGKWLLKDPANQWADGHEKPLPEVSEEAEMWAEFDRLNEQWKQLVRDGVSPRDLMKPVRPDGLPPLPEHEAPGWGWRKKLVSGLDCPFCVGTWLQIGALALHTVLPKEGPARTLFRIVTGGLTANWLLGHAAVRLGDTADDEDYDDQ